jgi:hypothetical protein
MGCRGRWGVGVMLCGLMLVGGFSDTGTAPARPRHVSLAPDLVGVRYWTEQVQSDSQLLVDRDLQEQDTANSLPPCARTPAVDPPCVGFALATATAISTQVDAVGQSVATAQAQISKDQAWLQAFEEKLMSDEAINRGATTGHQLIAPSRSGADPVQAAK